MSPSLLHDRRIIAAFGVVLLIAAASWLFLARNIVAVRVDMPGPDTARVYVEVIGSYRDGYRHETRALVREYVPTNRRVSFRIRSERPWRFEELSVRIAHPGMLTIDQMSARNPHWWRVSIDVKPAVLALSPESDSVSVSEIERHYQMVEDVFIQPLGLREASVQAWPHLRSMNSLFTAVSFRLEGQADLSAELKAERLRQLSDRLLSIEQRLRSVEFLPCPEGTRAVIGDDVAPGCGLKHVQYR